MVSPPGIRNDFGVEDEEAPVPPPLLFPRPVALPVPVPGGVGEMVSAGCGGGGAKGTDNNSGYVWKKRGAKVVPKKAPCVEASSAFDLEILRASMTMMTKCNER